MRPDILLFEKSAWDSAPLLIWDLEHALHRRRCFAHVIEVGFCTEISYSQKFQVNSEQLSVPTGMLGMLGPPFPLHEDGLACMGLVSHVMVPLRAICCGILPGNHWQSCLAQPGVLYFVSSYFIVFCFIFISAVRALRGEKNSKNSVW